MKLDLYFTYKNSIRFLLINRFFGINNTYNLPNIRKLILYFNFKKLEDLDNVELYNKFYLFKYFLGRNAFFSKTTKYYLLGTWYYNFNIQLIIIKSDFIYNLIFFIFNNIISSLEKNMLIYNISKYFNYNICNFLLKDMNIFSELKTNIGLFNVKKPLNIKLIISGFNTNYSFLNSLKFI